MGILGDAYKIYRIFKGRNKRRYEGASKTKRISNWMTPATSADAALKGSITTLRNRSRDLTRNNPHAVRGVDVLVNNIVGKGIVGTIKHPDKIQQKNLNRQWKEWTEGKQIDFDGRSNLFGLQRLVVRSMLEGGECLARSRVKTSGFPLEFQLLEGDHLGLTDVRKLDGGNRIIHGIEFNEDGKRVAYHVLKEHPGNSSIFSNQEKVRIPVEEMAHIFKLNRIGQNRGVPELAPVMIKLNDLGDYTDAQIVRQKIAASFCVFIHDIEAGDLNDDDEKELIEKIEPGMIEILPPGKDVKFASPPGVDGYREFINVTLREVAVGLGISFEALTGDLSEVNFSSARMGWLEMGRTIDVWRWLVLKPLFLDFVAQKFLQMAFLTGENVTGAKVVWTPPKRDMIDPTKEVPAAIWSIRAGISTLSEEIKKTGRHPDEHLAELKEDFDLLDELGLVLDCDPRKVDKAGVQADVLTNEGDDKDANT